MAILSIAAMAQFPSRVYLCGPAGPGYATKTWPMYTYTNESGAPTGVYEWVGQLTEGKIKFLYGTSWEPAYVAEVDAEGLTEGTHNMLSRLTYDGEVGDNQWLATAGYYKLTINVSEMTLTVEDGTGLEPVHGNDQSFYPDFLFIVGNGTGAGWSDGNAIATTTSEYGVYTITTTIYGHLAGETHNEFKFLSSQSWDMPQVGPTTAGEEFTGAGTYSAAVFTEGDNKWHNTTTETKEYTFTIDLNAGTMEVVEATPTALKSEAARASVKKMIINGELYILKNETLYTASGARVK